MTWQPPTPPPRPGGQPPYGQQRPGGGGPGGPGGPGGQGGQGPGGPGGPGAPGGQPQQQPGGGGVALKDFKAMNYYQLLQVNREAHSTIIRYAYRFLAAMYHPDNSETGDAEKFRIVTEAWRTLSDEGKRAAYDMSLGAQEEMQPRHPGAGGAPGGAPGGPANKGPQFNRDALKKNRTGVSWNEIELRLAVLQILLDARKKRPKTGGASAKMIMDILDLNDLNEMEFALWYLRERGLIEMGERLFMISANGVDYIVNELNRPAAMNESETEKKVRKVVEGGVPAVIPKDNGGG